MNLRLTAVGFSALVVFSAVLGAISWSTVVRLHNGELELPSDDYLISIAVRECNSTLSEKDIETLKKHLNPELPRSVQVSMVEGTCAFRFSGTVARSDLIGYGAMVELDGGTVFKLYSRFDERLISDGRPSMLVVPDRLFARIFL